MDFAKARYLMVENQLRCVKVYDETILDAFSNLPRERFVPKGQAGLAYMDEAVPVADGRYLMEAMILGRMLQSAHVGAEDAVLIVGCGTGYSAAVLADLCSAVVALEEDTALAALANATLADLGADNVAVIEGPLAEGYPSQAPYDVIVIDGSVDLVPDVIRDQLADGGRLVTIINEDGIGRARLITRVSGTQFTETDLFDAGSPKLPGFDVKPAFAF
ncbi:MAG: protein-L-isoaspartate O-methyltransferase family protein [Magnetovibrionaceae bacterium]